MNNETKSDFQLNQESFMEKLMTTNTNEDFQSEQTMTYELKPKIENFGLERDSYHLENVEETEKGLIATIITSYTPEVKIKVPLTKEVLKRGLKTSVPYLEEYEILLNNKTDDFDNFVKALFVTHINYRASYIPSQLERFPDVPNPSDDISEEEWKRIVDEYTEKSDRIELQIGWEFKESLTNKPLTAVEFYDKLGDKKIANLWEEAANRWGWNMQDVREITGDYEIDMEDFITHSDKFKRTVVSILVINFMDYITGIFGSNCDYPFDHQLTVEQILALPEK